MAKFDQGGGCGCGLYRECEPGCEHAPLLVPVRLMNRAEAEALFPPSKPRVRVKAWRRPDEDSAGWSVRFHRALAAEMAVLNARHAERHRLDEAVALALVEV